MGNLHSSAAPSGFACRFKEKPRSARGSCHTHLLLARRLKSVATQGVGVGHAHIAASHRAGSGVPFVRLGRLCGICSRSNGIGRPTRARGEGRITAIDRRGSAIVLTAIVLTSRATVGSTGISSRRASGWRRGVGWCRSVAWAGWSRSAILCIRPRHPSGRSQNAHSCECDENAFHHLPPFAFAEIKPA